MKKLIVGVVFGLLAVSFAGDAMAASLFSRAIDDLVMNVKASPKTGEGSYFTNMANGDKYLKADYNLRRYRSFEVELSVLESVDDDRPVDLGLMASFHVEEAIFKLLKVNAMPNIRVVFSGGYVIRTHSWVYGFNFSKHFNWPKL